MSSCTILHSSKPHERRPTPSLGAVTPGTTRGVVGRVVIPPASKLHESPLNTLSSFAAAVILPLTPAGNIARLLFDAAGTVGVQYEPTLMYLFLQYDGWMVGTPFDLGVVLWCRGGRGGRLLKGDDGAFFDVR